jgi:multidrug efflux pump subunit AcrA (membrane-fusion protein)
MKKASIIFVIVLAVGLAGFLGVKQVTGAGATPTSQPTLSPVQSSANIVAQASAAPVQEVDLAFAASGMVSQVLVKEGDTVQSGQVIARLAGSETLQASLSAAELDVLTATQDLTRLQEDANLQRAQAQQTLALAQTAYRKAKDHRDGMNYPRGTQYDVDNAWTAYQLALSNVSLAQEEYDKARYLPDYSVAKNQVMIQLTNAQKDRDQKLATYNWLTGHPTDEDLNTANADLAVAKAKLDDAQAQLKKLKDGPDGDQAALIQARLERANDAAAAARAGLANLELKAPFAGTVTSIAISAGEFAQPGMVAARLADTSAWLVKTTDLTELNVAAIQPGMSAAVKFDALPDAPMTGTVQSIETYGENHQSDIVYTVTLRLDQPDPRLRWNMTAVVTFDKAAK